MKKTKHNHGRSPVIMFITFICLIIIWILFLLFFQSREVSGDDLPQDEIEFIEVDEPNNEVGGQVMDEEPDNEVSGQVVEAEPIYLVEDIENLHLGKPFYIEDYYIRYIAKGLNYYYIDENNVLWGYGDNQFGQLGIGKQYTYEQGYVDWIERTAQKIAENVIHVDFSGEFFVIYLTKEGDLYGIGANLNGLMGMDVPEDYDYFYNPGKMVATMPVLLMQDVTYARCGYRSITALQKNGSVWWWGEFRTTSSKSGIVGEKLSKTKPEKMLEGAVYVTSGSFSAGAIKEDGSLWTWGNNTFGSCGIDSGEADFIEKPVKVLEQVKMVWFDSMGFDSSATDLFLGLGNPYACHYPYVTFVEKWDGSLVACGYEVEGEGSIKRKYSYFGDILRNGQTLEGERFDPVEVTYSYSFRKIDIMEKDLESNRKLAECEYGWSPDELTDYLEHIGMEYTRTEVQEGENREYYYVLKDQSVLFLFNGNDELTTFQITAYGSRNGMLKIGMDRVTAEDILGVPLEEEDLYSGGDMRVVYQMDDCYFTLYYQDGVVSLICESLHPYGE